MTRLEEIKAREAKATKGPWVAFWDKGAVLAIMPAGRPGDVAAFSLEGAPESQDAEFMLWARSDIPWLISRVEALEGALRTSENALSDMCGAFSWGTTGAFAIGVSQCKAALESVRAALGGSDNE